MVEVDEPTLQTDLDAEEAVQDIAQAVSTRHSIAHRYVLRIRRRHPDATPSEVTQLLERHYSSAITAAGAAITVGSLAAEIGIGLLPGGGAATSGIKAASKQVASRTTKEVAKAAAKSMTTSAAKNGVSRLVPAGEQQLQFEITAIFALALADIHGLTYDKDQAQALVFGLTNERVSQQQISRMAADLAAGSTDRDSTSHPNSTAAGSSSHWATTLADALPGGGAQTFVRTMQTGHLDAVRDSMTGKQRSAVDYGVAAVSGGITRFVFGRDVIKSTKIAFPPAPDAFPPHLSVEAEDHEISSEPSRALAALEEAARRTGTWISDTSSAMSSAVVINASAVGKSVTSTTQRATSIFRKIDLDGDGVPDEARAVTGAKTATGAVSDAASTVTGKAARLIRRKP